MEIIHTNLAHKIDEALLVRAFHKLRRDGATGIDGVTWKEYQIDLSRNIADLFSRLKNQKYRATALRQIHIPKEDGSQRTICIAALEDKLVQKAVVTLLEPIFEDEFLDVSFGFRPKKGQHKALSTLRNALMENRARWVIDLDIRKYFDTVPHDQLIQCIHRKVKDGGIDRLIGKWLKTGALENGIITSPIQGLAQGGVISPLLSNIYLHTVLDEWFEKEVKPRMRGKVSMVRFADDVVIGCDNRSDAERLMEVLPKRFNRFGLTLHPEKSKLIHFRPKVNYSPRNKDYGTFNFLGFTHYWGKSKNGHWVIKRRTMKKRLSRAKVQINDWCRNNRHLPLEEQQRKLSLKLRGHYGYYGIRGNSKSMQSIYRHAVCSWRKWLGKRRQKGRIVWDKFMRLLDYYPLPQPKIYHDV